MVNRQKPVTTPPDHGGFWTPLVVESCDACESL